MFSFVSGQQVLKFFLFVPFMFCSILVFINFYFLFYVPLLTFRFLVQLLKVTSVQNCGKNVKFWILHLSSDIKINVLQCQVIFEKNVCVQHNSAYIETFIQLSQFSFLISLLIMLVFANQLYF